MNLSGIHKFNSDDKVIVDTNVLMYVYCPLNSKGYESLSSHYSDTLQKLADAKASIFVNSLIVSEFINRWLRLDCRKKGVDLQDFKRVYRSSNDYTNTMRMILKQLKNFYLQCNAQNLDDNFSVFNIQSSYTQFPKSDFNDIIIAENAKINGCKVLTQDGDFAQYGVNVIR